MADNSTDFSTRCLILADLWINYRGDEQFQDFIEYNDLGLPLAYAIANNVVNSTNLAEQMINETWGLLLAGLEIEDEGFEDLLDMIGE